MKAIYTTAHGRVFLVNQSPKVPGIIIDANPGASARVSADSRARTVTETFSISTLEVPDTLSNREMANNMREFLKERKITHIDTVQDRYKILIEYSSEYNGQSLGRATLTRDILSVDGLIPLGVAVNDEDVFRHAKRFNTDIKFTISNTLPYGIMSQTRSTFKMKIHNIAIFADFNPMPADIHQSAYSTPYGYNDMTTRDNLQNMEIIYSSKAEGICFQSIDLSFVPRNVIISTDIVLTQYIDIFDKATIDKILEDNCKRKYPPCPVVPDDPDYPEHMFPQRDPHRPADGDDLPRGRSGWYDYYERCTATNPNALLVVENNLPADRYNAKTMIHIWRVYRDIPEIVVGDYVRYVQGFLDRSPRRPCPPHPPCPWPPYGEDGETSGDDTSGDTSGSETTGDTTDQTTTDTTDSTSVYDSLPTSDTTGSGDDAIRQFIEIPIEEV